MGRYMSVYHVGTFFLFLNFIRALTNVYYIHLYFSIFLTVYHCLRSIPALLNFHFEHCLCEKVINTRMFSAVYFEILNWSRWSASTCGHLHIRILPNKEFVAEHWLSRLSDWSALLTVGLHVFRIIWNAWGLCIEITRFVKKGHVLTKCLIFPQLII
jgi:hypothetical protein